MIKEMVKNQVEIITRPKDGSNWNNKEYPYLYETHLHTVQGSACAHNTGYEMAKAAYEYGYTGIIVTDHAWGGNTRVDRSLPWGEWVEQFAVGYYDAKRFSDSHDFDVFWGYEAGFDATEFLIYGVSPEWMIAHPELHDADVAEQYELIHGAGGMVIQAHPFRDENYIPHQRLFPHHVDGIEAINATHSSHLSMSHNNPLFDEEAVVYGHTYDFPVTAGSDSHTTNLFGGGMAFTHRLASIDDFIKAVLTRERYIVTNGDASYFSDTLAKEYDYSFLK